MSEQDDNPQELTKDELKHFDYTPSQQHVVNMITAHLKGDEDTAAKEVQQAFNI